MANAEEFCQFARFGQISKIQKALQTQYLDINGLNLYGESALSMATYYNQILCVEYLLAHQADPKLQLSAGHTAIHIACRMSNVPMVNLLLKISREEGMDDQQFQEREDRHLYECLQIKDHANLTPIHWAATQESVSKRQKMFAYLDRRMPGVLDSRYNNQWFHSWAKTHPWVIKQKSTTSPIRSAAKLTNTDLNHHQQQYSEQSVSLPLTKVTYVDMTPRTSFNDYERTPIPPSTATTIKTNAGYDEIYEKHSRAPPKVAFPPQTVSLPLTPVTSRIITSKHSHLKYEPHQSLTKTVTTKVIPEKTPYSQRLDSIVKDTLSPLSARLTYRAERAHVIPTFQYPPSPSDIDSRSRKGHDVDDVVTPISSKRPSHNLLSNIVPSTSTSSSEQSSRQSTKPFSSSFGFDASLDLRNHHDDDENQSDDDDARDYETHTFDYLCNSVSSLDLSSPGADTYNL